MTDANADVTTLHVQTTPSPFLEKLTSRTDLLPRSGILSPLSYDCEPWATNPKYASHLTRSVHGL